MVWWIVEGYPEGIQFTNFPSTNWIPWSPWSHPVLLFRKIEKMESARPGERSVIKNLEKRIPQESKDG